MWKPPYILKVLLQKLPIRMLLLLGSFVGALYVFAIIVHEIFREKEDEFDHAVLQFIQAHLINDNLTAFMRIITEMASARFLQVAFAVLMIIYIIRKNWYRSVEIIIIGIGGYIMNYLLKLAFQRVRPADPLIEGHTNFSFPSGHATSAFIFYGLIAYLLYKSSIPAALKYSLAAFSIILAILIGFSRIYLRVHYPTDVLAGFCIGFAWLLLCTWMFGRWRTSK